MYQTSFIKEKDERAKKIADTLISQGIDAIILADNANLYYTSGRIFNGYTYITSDGKEQFFVRRPIGLEGENIIYIRKPEQITESLKQLNIKLPKQIAIELDTMSYNDAKRMTKIFDMAKIVNASAIMRSVRSIKTEYEQNKLRESGIHHDVAYSHIKKLFREGMTDIELQIEIERNLRREGSLGQFRISGQSMEIFMGNLLCGDNADNPTPYDFAMGGAGLNPSLPVGCNGSIIKPGMSIMVDMCGNFNGYMTDMTRTFYTGEISELAKEAHKCSIEICHKIEGIARPGVAACDLYQLALEMAKKAGLENYFMGHKQKAGFIGHGVGIEINESPVISPRSKDILQAGNVIAIEPKFVIPTVGAVGIENTYIIGEDKAERITNFTEEITLLY
ncbi:MAG: Xaa-Pro peptidase family protein [Muribaculaceae bacterium]|nr:Xaa-Pro peptidase family protein [Muribaculaceae bacterium]